MKNIKTLLIAGAIFVILLIALFTSFRIIKNQKDTIARLESNQVTLLTNTKNEIIALTKKEFKETMPKLLDSTLTAKGIKPGQVQDVTYVNNHYYNYDTTIITPPAVITSKDTIYPFIDTKDCFTIGGYMRLLSGEPTLNITKRDYADSTTIIGFWDRPHKFWFVKWGRKQIDIESSSTCGDTKVQRIKIVKKKQ